MARPWQQLLTSTVDTTASAVAQARSAYYSYAHIICAVPGVRLYISDFKRSLTDKLAKDFFSEPSQVCAHCLEYIANNPSLRLASCTNFQPFKSVLHTTPCSCCNHPNLREDCFGHKQSTPES